MEEDEIQLLDEKQILFLDKDLNICRGALIMDGERQKYKKVILDVEFPYSFTTYSSDTINSRPITPSIITVYEKEDGSRHTFERPLQENIEKTENGKIINYSKKERESMVQGKIREKGPASNVYVDVPSIKIVSNYNFFQRVWMLISNPFRYLFNSTLKW